MNALKSLVAAWSKASHDQWLEMFRQDQEVMDLSLHCIKLRGNPV